jgi:arginase
MKPLIIEVPSPLGLRPCGLENAPAALCQAGLHEALGGSEPIRVNVPPYSARRDHQTGVLNPDGITTVAYDVAAAVEQALGSGQFPVLLGGDPSIVFGPMLALRRLGRHGLAFLDGHADFQHPYDELMGEVAALDLAILTGRGPDALASLGGLRPLVQDKDVALIGYRAFGENDEYRGEHVRSTGIKVIDYPQIRKEGIGDALATSMKALTKRNLDGYWIHLNVDVLDDAVMPAVDYRYPGGLSWHELAQIMAGLVAGRGARGLDVTFFNPRLDQGGNLARRLSNLLIDAVLPPADA